MALSKDWREFLELLNSRAIDYVIVGAQSLAFHARPRNTGDLDILVRPSPDNARLLLTLLNQLGFEQSGFKETDFLQPEQITQLGASESDRSADEHQQRVYERSVCQQNLRDTRWHSRLYPRQRRIDPKQASGRSAIGSRGSRRTRGSSRQLVFAIA